ncbi:MAG: PilW family protein [Candidatus Aminicenantes bacterium]
MKRFSKKRKFSPPGISLIEVLIAIAISAVVMLALLWLYSAGQKYFLNQNARADTVEDITFPLAWITRDIREAIQVVPGPVEVDGTYYSTSRSVLILELPSVDPGTGEIINFGHVSDYIIYTQNPDYPRKLERIIDAYDSDPRKKVVADKVLNFQVDFWTGDNPPVNPSVYSDTASIDISLTSKATHTGGDFQETFHTQVKLRNKSL